MNLPEPSFCSAEGLALQFAQAGEQAGFVVRLYDMFGRRLLWKKSPLIAQATLTRSEEVGLASPIPATLTTMPDGTLFASYQLTASGQYRVSVTVRGQPILLKTGHTAFLTIRPKAASPEQSTAVGIALSTGRAGVSESFLVLVRDELGNDVAISSPPNVFLTPVSDSAAPVRQAGTLPSSIRGTASILKNGTAMVNYVVTQAGTYLVDVMITEGGGLGRYIGGAAPCKLRILPDVADPTKTLISSQQNLSRGIAGAGVEVLVQLRDRFENNLTSTTEEVGLTFSDSSGVGIPQSQPIGAGRWSCTFFVYNPGTLPHTYAHACTRTCKQIRAHAPAPQVICTTLSW